MATNPSNAGIVRTLAGQSEVPASKRADGTTRTSIRIRPGFVPAEDVPKYRPSKARSVLPPSTSHSRPPSEARTPAKGPAVSRSAPATARKEHTQCLDSTRKDVEAIQSTEKNKALHQKGSLKSDTKTTSSSVTALNLPSSAKEDKDIEDELVSKASALSITPVPGSDDGAVKAKKTGAQKVLSNWSSSGLGPGSGGESIYARKS